MSLYNIYFSPTGGTKAVADLLVCGFGQDAVDVDFLKSSKPLKEITFTKEDVCIVSVPSYGGRVPPQAMRHLQDAKGGGAAAAAVVVFGNRAIEDTLIELRDGLVQAGFRCFGGVSAVAQHSTYPHFGAGRPDAKDKEELLEFGKLLAKNTDGIGVHVPGNAPYKSFGGSPLKPYGNENCIQCGVCAAECSAGAIPAHDPKSVDGTKCISCMRCIAVCPHHARINDPAILADREPKLAPLCAERKPNTLYLPTKRTGLVLEGGAMRGMFTAGVLDVFMENGITFDGAVGVSAGAVFGCNFKSGQIGRVIRYNKKYCRDPRYCSYRSLIKTGDLYGVDFCYNKIPYELDLFDIPAYQENPMEFYVVTADADTGKAIYHRCDKGDRTDLDWLRASASMPLVSRVVEKDGYRMLDGGISDSIPLEYFQSAGYNRNVVVLTQPKGFVKQKTPKMWLMKWALRKYPKFLEALAHRHQVYNAALEYVAKEEAKGSVFVIRPPQSLAIGSVCHDDKELERVYQTGRKTALENLAKVKEFLGK